MHLKNISAHSCCLLLASLLVACGDQDLTRDEAARLLGEPKVLGVKVEKLTFQQNIRFKNGFSFCFDPKRITTEDQARKLMSSYSGILVQFLKSGAKDNFPNKLIENMSPEDPNIKQVVKSVSGFNASIPYLVSGLISTIEFDTFYHKRKNQICINSSRAMLGPVLKYGIRKSVEV